MYLWQFAFDDSELSFLDDEVRFVHIPSLYVMLYVWLFISADWAVLGIKKSLAW